jgi:DsbC/DsbD-like thiol-disulfide interchange protein
MRLPIALFVSLLGTPAFAGATPWQDVAPQVRMRLVSTGTIDADGTTLLGLEIDMPQSMKTYWRVPGDTGLPLELDLHGSRGVSAIDIHWPYPERDQTPSYLDYVYRGALVLPMTAKVEGDGELMMDASLGICSDICMPVRASFALDLQDGTPDGPNRLRLRQAMAETPIGWTGDTAPVGSVTLDGPNRQIAVQWTDPAVDPASLIVTTHDGTPLIGAPQKSPQADLVLLPVLGDEPLEAGEPVELVFMTDTGAFEISQEIGLKQ